MPKSAQVSALTLLTAKMTELETRLIALEVQLAELQASNDDSDNPDLTGWSNLNGSHFGSEVEKPDQPQSPTVRLGRPPRIAPGDFALRRDQLVTFIEVRWEILAPRIRRRSALTQLLEALLLASPGAKDTWPYKHLKEHIAQLSAFLNSGRYNGEPRQIAYAMAGLSELTWRSSLDLGTKHPSVHRLALQAMPDHIMRRNRRAFQQLAETGITRQSVGSLKKCCSDCRAITTRPKQMEELRTLIHSLDKAHER